MAPSRFDRVHAHVESILPRIQRPATGRVPYPYLVVSYGAAYAGVVYTWDHHHMAMRLAHAGRPEYLRHLADNALHYQTPSGFVPSCMHPELGAHTEFTRYHAQPYLMQGAWLYTERTGDTAWAAAAFPRLCRYLEYYRTRHAVAHGVHCWAEPYMSGFDNDAATCFFMPGTVVPADLSSWLVLEFRAAALLAARLGRDADRALWTDRAADLARRVNDLFWYDRYDTYAAWHMPAGRHQFHYDVEYVGGSLGEYAFQTCSNLIPLYAGIAPPERARRMLERYVLTEEHFLSPWGIRSLSRRSEYCNNAKWGNPPRFTHPERLTNSNWQGPVWIPLCYFMAHALNTYGYSAQAQDVADRTLAVLARCLDTTGTWMENFDGDTGAPLYAADFASWNLLADILPAELAPGAWPMAPLVGAAGAWPTRQPA